MAASDKAFGFQVDNLSNVRKSIAQTTRSQDSMNAAMSKARSAQSPEDYAEVDRLLQRAASYAGEASSSAGTEYANRVRLYQARQQKMAVANTMTDIDQQRVVALEKATVGAKANLDAETAKLNSMKEYVKTIIEATSLSTGIGKARTIKTGQQIAEDAQLGEEAWTNLINLMTSGETKGINLDAILGLGDLRQKLDANIKGLPALKAQIEFNYKPQLLALAADGEKVRARFGEPFMIKYNIDPTNPFTGLMEAQKKLLEEQE